MVARRLREQPMQAHNGEARVCGQLAQPGALVVGDLTGIRGQRERRDLDPREAECTGTGEGVVLLPVLKRLVANGEVHQPGKTTARSRGDNRSRPTGWNSITGSNRYAAVYLS